MTNRAKALEALEDAITNAEHAANALFGFKGKSIAVDMVRDCIPEMILAAKDAVAALQDAPKVEVIDGLEDALNRLNQSKENRVDVYPSGALDYLSAVVQDSEIAMKAARAYAKLQGKGE